MKKHIRNLLLSGAVVAASAQAATYANIQFPFSTPAGNHPAGRYAFEVQDSGGGKYVQIRNLENGSSVMFHPSSPILNMSGVQKARLVFSCSQASNCSLQKLLQSSGNGMEFKVKKLTPGEAERLAVVQLEAKPAE